MLIGRQSERWRMAWLLLSVIGGTAIAQTVQQCPPQKELLPCSCSVKKSGLDIICEFTDFSHISKAMDVLKKRQNTIIVYLKLRHNSLPKLQGFVFLGLDIIHLTIHNSSLAVIEETSLTSIGMTHFLPKQVICNSKFQYRKRRQPSKTPCFFFFLSSSFVFITYNPLHKK